ncbi:MAG: 3-deoxy-D-manno-octulosonic acid transferase [Pseudomonadota bacterium]
MSLWVYVVYLVLSLLYLPIALTQLVLKAIKDPTYRAAWNERLALGKAPSHDWKAAPLKIWVHAVSLGETRAITPLIQALAHHHPDACFLMTHSTPTGRQASEALLKPILMNKLEIRYLPYDVPGIIDIFISRWAPTICLLVETELWPALLVANSRKKIPSLLVNARLSARSARRYAKAAWLTRPSVQYLTLILAQDRYAARRFKALGVKQPIPILGNLKFEPLPLSDAHQELGQILRNAWAGNPHKVILASSRPGEEEAFLQALTVIFSHNMFLKHLKESSLLAITIVPRHIERRDEIIKIAHENGWLTQTKSNWNHQPHKLLNPASTLFIGDTLGELNAYYLANDIALLGGSFKDYGAQNPLEALKAGCVLMVGASRFNFQSIILSAIQAKALYPVENFQQAIETLPILLQNANQYEAHQQAGKLFCQTQHGILERYVEAINTIIKAHKTTSYTHLPPQPS